MHTRCMYAVYTYMIQPWRRSVIGMYTDMSALSPTRTTSPKGLAQSSTIR